MSRCPAGCPNAPEPEPDGLCAVCGEPVYCWEDYFEFDGDLVHADCAPEYVLGRADRVHKGGAENAE